jgi:hypothetical protein
MKALNSAQPLPNGVMMVDHDKVCLCMTAWQCDTLPVHGVMMVDHKKES